MMSGDAPQTLLADGKRIDGRSANQIRPLRIEAGLLQNADGSAYIEQGNNKILVAVYGPREVQPKHLTEMTRAIIKCRYMMAPFSSIEGHGRTGPNRRATEISKVIKEVFENVVLLNEFPQSQIEVFVEVLQADGSTRTAGVTAAAVALADAGIPMRDIVYGVSIGKLGETLVTDLNMIEDNYAQCDMALALSPRTGEVLLLQMEGSLTKEQLDDALRLGAAAGEHIGKAQRSALRKLYYKG